MQVITQPDGSKNVFEKGEKIAYVEDGHLFMVGSGTSIADNVSDASEIVQSIKQYRSQCDL